MPSPSDRSPDAAPVAPGKRPYSKPVLTPCGDIHALTGPTTKGGKENSKGDEGMP